MGPNALVLGALATLSLVLIWATSLFGAPVEARSGGIVGASGNPDAGGGSTCSDCHAAGAPTPTITISAPASVNGGDTVPIEVTVTGGSGIVAGFNASMSDLAGDLTAGGIDTRVLFNEITHTSPKQIVNGSATFAFEWTAPLETGAVEVFAAGLSANGNGTTSGDGVGATSTVIQVQAPVVVGDVDCSGELNIVDALVTAQYAAQIRSDTAQCPVMNPATQLVASQGDMNNDQITDIVDALLMAQCAASIDNGLCG